jgi:hypothetical protein
MATRENADRPERIDDPEVSSRGGKGIFPDLTR